MASTKTTNQLANEIIKLFIDNDISLNKQLEILKIARQKIEFCRSTRKKISQKELFD